MISSPLFSQKNIKVEDQLDIIAPLPFEPNKNWVKSSTSQAIIWAGRNLNAINIEKYIQEAVFARKDDLKKFYSEEELTQLASKINQHIFKSILECPKDFKAQDSKDKACKQEINDQNLIKIYEYAGISIASHFMDTIMKQKGVESHLDRKMWVQKTIQPFNRCIAKASNAFFDADHCVQALTAAVLPTIGAGIVYDKTKSKVFSSMPKSMDKDQFLIEQAVRYKDCIVKRTQNAKEVEKCALYAMALGIADVTDVILSEILNKQLPNKSIQTSIKEAVWTNYRYCLESVIPSEQFSYEMQYMRCVNTLSREAALLIVPQKIATHPVLRSIKSPSEVKAITELKTAEFKQCFDQVLVKNDKERRVDFSVCELTLTNQITYDTINTLFKSNTEAKIKDLPLSDILKKDLIQKVQILGKNYLDRCWGNLLTDSSRDQCARIAIVDFAVSIGDIIINSSIDSEDPLILAQKIKAKEVLRDCLLRDLPKNVTESIKTMSYIDACSDLTTKSTAVQIASLEVSKNTVDSLGVEASQKYVEENVKQNFKSCLNRKKSKDQLKVCTTELQNKVVLKMLQINLNKYFPIESKLSNESLKNSLQQQLFQQYLECMSKDPLKCIDQLKIDATVAIAQKVGGEAIYEQFLSHDYDRDFGGVFEQLADCPQRELKGSDLSLSLDKCVRQYSLTLARKIAAIKLRALLESSLGTDEFNTYQSEIKLLNQKYEFCLVRKNNIAIQDHIKYCVEELHSLSMQFVQGTLEKSLNLLELSKSETLQQRSIKFQFIRQLPHFAKLMPNTPIHKIEKSGDRQSSLKPLLALIGGFIDFDPQVAATKLEEVSLFLQTKHVSSPEYREAAIQLLIDNGSLDLIIKSIIAGKINESLKEVVDDDIPSSLKAELASKENLNRIFKTSQWEFIQLYVAEKILKPIILKGENFTSPALKTHLDVVTQEVKIMLTQSEYFSQNIAQNAVRLKLKNQNSIVKFFAKILYGKDAMNWNVVRKTRNGIEAERYINDYIVAPMIMGEQSANQAERLKQAEKMVKKAVKKYFQDSQIN